MFTVEQWPVNAKVKALCGQFVIRINHVTCFMYVSLDFQPTVTCITVCTLNTETDWSEQTV